MTKKARMREQILNHGFKLKRIFFADTKYEGIGPVELCKKVHRLETKAHRMSEDYCNGIIDLEFEDRQESKIMKSLDNILNFKAQNIPVIFNGDPRGYALKIDDEYVKAHNLDIHRDWGGYGIIAPEFDGSK